MAHTTPPTAQVIEHEARVSIAQGNLYTKRWTPGDGNAALPAPIVLFHDSLGCVALWRGFPAKLAAATGRAVIAYDRLGFGRSDPHPARLGFDFVAQEAEAVVPALCEQLGIGRFIACGHSVGGGMAVEAAARSGGNCIGLITLGAQAFAEGKTLEGIRKAKLDFADQENLARLARYHGDKARWVVDAWTDTWLAPEFASWTLDAALSRIACPVLAIHGEMDEYGSTAHPLRIAEGRGQAEILPGAGHVPYRESEALVLAIIQRFVRPLD